jgi:Family of unknown function (DUF6065)
MPAAHHRAETKLIVYPTSDVPILVEPASSQRLWMDVTRSSFAYRCLPLTIANAHGWVVLNRCAFRALWKGGHDPVDTLIEAADAPEAARPSSHFGEGVLTFQMHALFRTEPGIDLWVGGPPNAPKDGIQPLTGVIESDWSPYTFTMNWLFTRPHQWVSFEEGEPICHFFPLPRGLIESTHPEIRPLEDDPRTGAHYRSWSEGRERFNADLKRPESDASRQKWQKSYYRGLNPDGSSGAADHSIKIRARPFRTGRQNHED